MRKLVRIAVKGGLVVKIYRTGTPSFPFEFKLRLSPPWYREAHIRQGRGWKWDPTSHGSTSAALQAAEDCAGWYVANTPRRNRAAP